MEDYISLLKKNRDIKYKTEVIKRILNEKEGLRNTFISVLVNEPARKQDIQEDSHYTARTIYLYLYKLASLGLIEKVSVMDLWNKEELTEVQGKVLGKFKKWTFNMSPNQRNYFAAKTNYWVVTEFGKEEELIKWAYKLDCDIRQ